MKWVKNNLMRSLKKFSKTKQHKFRKQNSPHLLRSKIKKDLSYPIGFLQPLITTMLKKKKKKKKSPDAHEKWNMKNHITLGHVPHVDNKLNHSITILGSSLLSIPCSKANMKIWKWKVAHSTLKVSKTYFTD